ncbi:lytic transglycosylase domain-containing protein [Candidatus Binatia bacterium]|nr:lytic transglycosylase domain-containing protein [Candidatus Binatia bacterium]
MPIQRAATTLLAAVLALGALRPSSAAAADGVYSFRDRKGTLHFTNVPTDNRFKAVPALPDRPIRISLSGRIGGDGTTRAGRAALARADRIWSEAPADLEKLIDETSRRYGVETALVHAVVRAESAFDHLAVSSSGAQGLMQLMPGTAQEVGVRDVFHPQQNLEGGVYYLRSLIDRFNGDLRLALAGYNAGPGAVERFGGVPPYTETLDYVERVFRYRQEYLLSQRGRPARVLVASR